jgi:hypothetical protein
MASMFAALVFFTAAVSVHDTVLVILYDQNLADFEQNPVGQWLITLGGGDVGLLVFAKLLGTSVACAMLVAFYRPWPVAALAMAAVIACFQLGLLLYLSLA